MGLFSKIFGGTTEEGTDPSSKEGQQPAEQAADAAASKATPDASASAAAQPPLAKAPASRKEPERAPEPRPSVPARKAAKTDGLFGPSDPSEPRVVVAQQPPRAPAVADASTSRSAAAPTRETTPSRQASPPPPPPPLAPAAPAKAAANEPAPPAPPAAKQPASAAATGSAKTAARESSRPGARGSKATPAKSATPARASKTGKQAARADAPPNAEATAAAKAAPTVEVSEAPETLDLDSLPPPPPDAPAPAPPRAPMDSRVEPEDDVDRAFALVASGEVVQDGVPGMYVVDPIAKEHNANLFREMAIGFARPVRDFMLELVLGPTTKQWLDIAKGPIQNLLQGATEFELKELAAALVDFKRGVDEARTALGAMVTGGERARLLAQYEALVRALPTAFDLKGERSRREPMIVHHLLLQVPGVHQLAIDKLYAAGLASLEGLGRSSVGDLMAHARLERDGAEAIVRRFRAYLRERTEQVLEKGEAQVRQRLLALVDELGRAHQEFRRADADEDRPAKRRARIERRARALEMNVLLAQLGEIDLIAELERSATDQRIERMRSYVASSGGAKPMRQETV